MANILLNQFRHMDKSNMQTGLKLVLMYLCDLANKDTQIAFPAIATIAREIGMSTKQVRRWTHDLENRKAYLHKTKNGEARQVPLTLLAVEVLRALPKIEDKVFPMTFDSLRSQFKRLKSHLNQSWDGYGDNPFNDLRFHDFRHEALSRLSDTGLNVIELSHISGHKTLGMLKRYTHPAHSAILFKLDKNL